MIKNLLFFKTISKINLFFIYLITLLIVLISIYLVIPKLFNYLNTKDLIIESLSSESGLNISKISRINYSIFPTPRLNITNVEINFKNNSFEIENGTVKLILNINNLLNSKKIKYKKIFITDSSPRVDITEMSNLLKIIENNKKNIFFKKNDFIFIYKNKTLFELKNTNAGLSIENNVKKLNLTGYLLEKKTSINYLKKQRHSLSISIPDINLSIKFLFTKKNKIINGNSNIQIMDNFIRFDFTKGNEFIIENGFFRNKLIKTDIEGIFQLDPIVNIRSNLDFKNLDLEILNNYIFKKISNLNEKNIKILKKINGVFNINFNDHFSGEITTENGTIYLKEFIISTPKYDLYLDGSFIDKDDFRVFKYQLLSKYNIKKEDFDLQFNGSINFTNKKIKFEKIIKNKVALSKDTINKYEKLFQNIVINKNFERIYDYKRINNFFNSIVNNF